MPLLVEIFHLQPHVEAHPSAGSICEDMRKRYCLGPATFTEEHFRSRMDDILLNCRGIERARLALPLPFVVSDELTTTFILANALAALGRRPEEDSAALKVLVLENVTGIAIRNLSYNPLDRKNILTVFGDLDHLVLSTKGNASYFPSHRIVPTELWRFIGMAASLKTLCLIGLDCGGEPPSTALRHSRAAVATDGMPEADWQESIFPPPFFVGLHRLTCLELRRMDLTAEFFLSGVSSFGLTLRELYLNKVCLKIRKGENEDGYPINDLWVGLPNTTPGPKDRDRWVAHIIRSEYSKIHVCRATHLSYDFYGSAEDLEALHGLDINDPCGLNRDLARRFVEVAMGYEQPELENGEPCTMFPSPTQNQPSLKPATKDMQPSSWDVAAYRDVMANPTSKWLDSIDGCFPNDKSTGVTALRDLTGAWCRGLNNRPAERFHPEPPDTGFRVIYEDDTPLGVLIGRVGPRLLHQVRVGHGDDINDDWVPMFETFPAWSPTEPSESDPGDEDDDVSDKSGSVDEGDTEEEGYNEPGPWEYYDSFPSDSPTADAELPIVLGYANSPNDSDVDEDASQNGFTDDSEISSNLDGDGRTSLGAGSGVL